MSEQDLEKRIRQLERDVRGLVIGILAVMLCFGVMFLWNGDIEAKVIRAVFNQTPIEFERTHSLPAHPKE